MIIAPLSLPKRTLAGFLAGALAGCSLLAPTRAPAPRLFTLQPGFAVADVAADATAPRTIAISLPSARPGFDGPRMVYVTRPYEIQYFSTHEWVVPPARLLAPLLRLALARSGRLRVVETTQVEPPALRLQTEVVALQQEFNVRPSQVRFALRARLDDGATGHLVAETELETTEPADSEDPYGGVVAANRAVGRVLEELAAWCAAVP
ncbi:MAG TPA: ABC-type transport auxiliary lipoprotein family protein [Myxococcota bacterium]|nr:ABC-type transport auxiliary lipoprotein family protein [Myxococcota bacterium]